jgi:hypothetical protein
VDLWRPIESRRPVNDHCSSIPANPVAISKNLDNSASPNCLLAVDGLLLHTRFSTHCGVSIILHFNQFPIPCPSPVLPIAVRRILRFLCTERTPTVLHSKSSAQSGQWPCLFSVV